MATLKGCLELRARRTLRCAALIGGVLVGAAAAATPAGAKTPNCMAAQARSADKWLWLNGRDKEFSLARNLPWGTPRPTAPVTNEELLIHWDYVIGYDDDLRVPLWTGERVIGKKLGYTTRSDCFRPDPRLRSAAASGPTDYDEPVFDQGHVTPSADVTISKISVWNSFIMSNMTPQYALFNRVIWRKLEDYVRRWAIANGTAYIVTGSIFDRNGDGRRDADSDAPLMKPRKGVPRVAIPTAFYEVIAVEQPDHSLRTLAFILPNKPLAVTSKDTLPYLTSKIVRLEAIEQVTSTDLFPTASAIAQDDALWPIPNAPPRKKTKRKRVTQ
jgi:endonuclease G